MLAKPRSHRQDLRFSVAHRNAWSLGGRELSSRCDRWTDRQTYIVVTIRETRSRNQVRYPSRGNSNFIQSEGNEHRASIFEDHPLSWYSMSIYLAEKSNSPSSYLTRVFSCQPTSRCQPQPYIQLRAKNTTPTTKKNLILDTERQIYYN